MVDLTRAFGSGSPTSPVPHASNYALGLLLAVGCCLTYALWLITETKMSQSYPCFYSMTTLICFMASIQSVIYAFCMERKSEEWKLGWNIRLWTVAYSGLVAMGLMFTLIAWVVSVKGPLFVSIFSTVSLVLVAIMASLILDEKLHVGRYTWLLVSATFFMA
ncbi:WAT1-related protein At1g68170-like isoform X2 [Macadamia integrifolia]|uniref:WAT1-related protein At1g68170-like isoform X2 n=1 Tax=Macadamia integrifolia TaxID=60698 RepID=UPI001C528012|nr:WAT1-related protein At1g68170-like isoform X2 [Macadamia integrifolia]